MNNADAYLKAMMSLIARQTFTPEKLRDLVSTRRTTKLLKAFNMCDGTKTQSEIANELAIDNGNFSRTVTQWVDEGIIIRIDDGGGMKLVHVYPLPEKFLKTSSKKVA